MNWMMADGWRERLLFRLLLVFVIGYYWCPSTRALQSTPHDLIFYIGFLPAFLLLTPCSLWRAPSRSTLLALSMAFVLYLGESALWTHGETELSLAMVGLYTLSTAVFVVGASELLSPTRWRQLTTAVAIAATSIASVSVVAFIFGRRYVDNRLNSAIHFEHPNLFAHYLGFAALLCLLRFLDNRRRGDGRTLPWVAAITILVAAIVLTAGRTPMAALIIGAGLAVGFGGSRRTAALLAALMIVILGWAALDAGGPAHSLLARGDAGRDVIYKTFIDRTAGHRWYGLGIAAVDDMQFPKGSWEFPRGKRIRHPHSAFLATFYFGGFLGLGLLLVVLGFAVFRAAKILGKRGDPTGVVLLAFGVVCLLPDGQRLVSYPHLSSWLILWLPVSWIVAAGRERCTDIATAAGEAPVSLENAAPGRRLFWLLAIVFFAQRLLHLGPDIDTPQMWRQCDTAQYIRSFAEEGIDLLHPSVCWLADHKTTILEFPLPEAAAAVAYKVFGVHHAVARAVFLLFFIGSAFFLFRFVQELADETLARMVVLIYLIMPLSLYYSRAIHIDFSALFFVHGMAFFFARGLRLESTRLMWFGSLFATLAMMIKAPYVLPVVAPLTILVVREKRWSFILRSLPAFMVPAAIFGLWEWHVYRVNSQAPDWFFIPHYRKLVQNGAWYFGTTAQRLDPDELAAPRRAFLARDTRHDRPGAGDHRRPRPHAPAFIRDPLLVRRQPADDVDLLQPQSAAQLLPHPIPRPPRLPCRGRHPVAGEGPEHTPRNERAPVDHVAIGAGCGALPICRNQLLRRARGPCRRRQGNRREHTRNVTGGGVVGHFGLPQPPPAVPRGALRVVDLQTRPRPTAPRTARRARGRSPCHPRCRGAKGRPGDVAG